MHEFYSNVRVYSAFIYAECIEVELTKFYRKGEISTSFVSEFHVPESVKEILKPNSEEMIRFIHIITDLQAQGYEVEPFGTHTFRS